MIDDLLNEPMRRLNRLMSDRAEGNRAGWIAEILKVADQWRPEGYRRACTKLQDYYNNQQQDGLMEQLRKSFPETWKRLPTDMILPVLRRWIDQQATVYLTPPARTLIDQNGEAVEEGPVSEAFEQLQKDAAYWEVWQQLDRMVHLFNCSLLMFGWNSWRQRLEAHVVAPHLVHIVPDPDDPSDLSRAWAILVELASSNGIQNVDDPTDRRFLAYWRGEGENGRDEWQAVVMHENGRVELGDLEDAMDFTAPVRDGDGRTVLPFVWVQKESQHGVVYSTPNIDLLLSQDAVNEAWVDIHSRARTSGYGSYVATSLDTDRARGALNIAPGGVTILEEGETLTTLTADSRLSEHVDILQTYLLQQAQRLGLAPSSWSPTDRPNLSGVALKVENLEAETHRAEQVNRYERIEESDAFNIARSVWNTYSVPNGSELLPWELKMQWRAGPTSLPIDEEAQRRILDHDVSKNWITSAQAMSRALGITEQQAQQNLKDNTAQNRQQIQPAGLGLAEAALGIVSSDEG
jgi:aryl-alcohol dehydrogenase-like predicted oxidoreductase